MLFFIQVCVCVFFFSELHQDLGNITEKVLS